MEVYLSDMANRKFEGTTDDPVGDFYGITHDCPFCGNRASASRSLIWVARECIANGRAVFQCAGCEKYVTIPSAIFVEGALAKIQRSDLFSAITRMTLHDLLTPNWGEVILETNKSGLGDLESLGWDGTGACPGCGRAQAEEFSQGFNCVRCEKVFWVHQNDISRTNDTMALCHHCGKSMVIPPTVWCQVCGRNLRPEKIILKLFQKANGVLS